MAWIVGLGFWVAPSAPLLWQPAQPVATVTLAWKRPGFQVVKLAVALWQVSQLADAALAMPA